MATLRTNSSALVNDLAPMHQHGRWESERESLGLRMSPLSESRVLQ